MKRKEDDGESLDNEDDEWSDEPFVRRCSIGLVWLGWRYWVEYRATL